MRIRNYDHELENFVKKIIEELKDPDLGFLPHLASEGDLNKLAESLAQWCSSFLAGFALGCGEERANSRQISKK